MDKQRGVALVMSLLFVAVLSILAASLFFNVINESRLVRRYVNSTQALWLAERGIAETINNNLNNISETFANGDSYTANTLRLSDPAYYQVDSTGSVGSISRSVRAIVRIDPVEPNNFQHAVRTTSELVVKGNVTINGPQEEFASLNFADLFEHTKEDMRSYATHLYQDPRIDVTPVDGITWVDLSPGGELRISSSTWQGSGILVVAGDAQITGGTFDGIIYVIGKLRMSGNPTVNGSILAESNTEIDTDLTGNVTINYNSNAIINALSPLQFIAPVTVSWKEI